MVTATLKNYRQSPRKVRLVADQVRGKKALAAITELTFTPKRASLPVQKLIESAVANAEHNSGLKAENLIIKEIRVNDGFSMKRFIPKARGMAHPIKKRTCHVEIVLVDITAPVESTSDDAKKEVADNKDKK